MQAGEVAVGEAVKRFGRDADVTRAVLVGLAVSLGACATWLLNVTAYPSFNDFFPLARDIATAFGGLLALGFVYLSMRRPALFCGPAVLVCCVASLALGSAGMFWASSLSSPAAATLFACLRSLGGAFGGAYLTCALLDLPLRHCLLALVCGSAGKYLWMALLWFAPYEVRCVALALFGIANASILYACARPAMRGLAELPPAVSLEATNPFSFLPFTSGVFVAVLLFHAAFGFAITYGSQQSYPQPTIMAFVAFVIAMGLAVFRRATSLDAFFTLAFAFAFLGMLLVLSPSSGGVAGSLSNAFLQAGGEVTSVVVRLLLVMAATRNRVGLLPMVFSMACASGLGTELGAASGHLENFLESANTEAAFLFAAAIAFSFAMYNLVLVRKFSFDSAVEEVRPATPVQEMAEQDARTPLVERRVAELVTSCSLTPREAEVFALLARGRNAAYIQESLTLSRNTVKSYVARVYGKLGVHSHQELIDLVEGR